MSSITPRKVRCPICSKEAEWSSENPFRPFCSERCRKIDLGAWAAEEYRVAQRAPTDDDPAAPDAQA